MAQTVKVLKEVPALMCCWVCEHEGKKYMRRRTEMYIKSNKMWARHGNCVLWKCPTCGLTKVEKFRKPDEGLAFWLYAEKKGWVLEDDSVYTKRLGRRQ